MRSSTASRSCGVLMTASSGSVLTCSGANVCASSRGLSRCGAAKHTLWAIISVIVAALSLALSVATAVQ